MAKKVDSIETPEVELSPAQKELAEQREKEVQDFIGETSEEENPIEKKAQEIGLIPIIHSKNGKKRIFKMEEVKKWMEK